MNSKMWRRLRTTWGLLIDKYWHFPIMKVYGGNHRPRYSSGYFSLGEGT